MTRLQLENLAADWLNDRDKTYFTPTWLQMRLNLAQKTLQMLLIDAYQDFYTTCALTTTVVNQERYKVPSDFIGIRKIEILTSGSGDTASRRQLDPMDMHETYKVTNQTGDPTHYFLGKNHIHLKQVPSSAKTMELHYIYLVDDMAADVSEPDAPEEYHEFIAILAVEDNLIKDTADSTAILNKKAYFENKIAKLASNRKPDGPRMMRTA